MKNYNELVEVAEDIAVAAGTLEKKHIKTESARQRKRINRIQQLAVIAKKELMAEDKK